MRRLLETQAALAGIKLDIAWEVSSVPSIIELVCAGYGHAVLTASGVAASPRSGELAVRRLVDPAPVSVLCLVISAHRRPTPLTQHTMRLLTALVREASRLIISRIARAGRPCRIAIAVIGSGRWRSAGRLATVRAANSPFPSRPPRRARGKPALGRRQEMLGPSSRIAQWEHASMFRRTFLTCATFGAMSAPALPNAPIASARPCRSVSERGSHANRHSLPVHARRHLARSVLQRRRPARRHPDPRQGAACGDGFARQAPDRRARRRASA